MKRELAFCIFLCVAYLLIIIFIFIALCRLSGVDGGGGGIIFWLCLPFPVRLVSLAPLFTESAAAMWGWAGGGIIFLVNTPLFGVLFLVNSTGGSWAGVPGSVSARRGFHRPYGTQAAFEAPIPHVETRG